MNTMYREHWEQALNSHLIRCGKVFFCNSYYLCPEICQSIKAKVACDGKTEQTWAMGKPFVPAPCPGTISQCGQGDAAKTVTQLPLMQQPQKGRVSQPSQRLLQRMGAGFSSIINMQCAYRQTILHTDSTLRAHEPRCRSEAKEVSTTCPYLGPCLVQADPRRSRDRGYKTAFALPTQRRQRNPAQARIPSS